MPPVPDSTILQFRPRKDVSTATVENVCPGFRVKVNGNTATTYESTNINDDGMLTGSVLEYDFYESGAIYFAPDLRGDWMGTNVKVTVSKVDLDAKLVFFTATGDMFSSGDAFMHGTGIPHARTSHMEVIVENVPLL